MRHRISTWLAAACISASVGAQTDMTSRLNNPDFELNFTGWVQYGMQRQDNTSFSRKNGKVYVEKWVNRGTAVGSCRVSQLLTNLPVGVYELTAAAQNIQQDTPTAAQTGVSLFAGSEHTTVTVPDDYTVRFAVVATGTSMEVGFEATAAASGNYTTVDNFRLLQVSSKIADAKALLHSRLETLLEASRHQLEGSKTQGRDAYSEAIEAAQAVADNASATGTALTGAMDALRRADLQFLLDNATGTAPKVTTDTRTARGADVIYGRSTVGSSSLILEQGFCWSTHPEPTVLDNRSTLCYDYNGKVYVMPGLQPSTEYYVRAYAMTKYYAVSYGDVVKVCTIPRGAVGWSYNANDADEATSTRIRSAVGEAVDSYWNHLTSISGFHVTANYASGTPTADCSYGGWVRFGPNASYQRTGTAMHEMLHGIGVGTNNMWWNAEMRSNGDRGLWYGNRTSELINFWDNKTDAILNGDNTHLWPYGINGANEDNGSNVLYTITSMMAQALWEDGLPVTTGAFACPAYVFPQQDEVRYYLKNEDEQHGRYSSYLYEEAGLRLSWKEMDGDEAQNDDRAAWTVTFDPASRCYRFRNVATNHYLAYTDGSFRAQSAAAALQLMKGRTDIDLAGKKVRGYWMLNASGSRYAMAAGSSSAVTAAAYNLANAATTQRWLILTADEAKSFDTSYLAQLKTEMESFIKQVNTLRQTPYYEATCNADADLDAALEQVQTALLSGSISQVRTAKEQLHTALLTFLGSVRPMEDDAYFDLTFMIQNPGFDTDANGWTTSETPTAVRVSCIEFYEKTFDINQTLTEMPAGRYTLLAQAFQRPGDAAAAYSKRNTATAVTSLLCLGSASKRLKNITADAQAASLHSSDSSPAEGVFFPNSMEGAAVYFAKNLYENEVSTTLNSQGALKLGVRCTSKSDKYWTLFDNFRLHYYGDATLVGTPDLVKASDANAWYDISGRRVEKGAVRRGVFIVGGRKIVR